MPLLLTACTGAPSAEHVSASTGPVRPTDECVVGRIVDGDTIECVPIGRIRLIGIDAPEYDQRPYAGLSSEALGDLIPPGTRVLVEPDVEAADPGGRALRYVWSGGELVNWVLVREGYAVVLTYPPNVQYVQWFEAAVEAARSEGLGLWEIDGFACEPLDHRRGRC